MFHTIALIWLVIRLLVVAGIPAVIVTRLTIAVVGFARLPTAAKRNYPAACWHRFRWRALARRLDLARPDPHRHSLAIPLTSSAVSMGHRDRLLYPRARFRADPYGLRVRVRTIPGVGRQEVEDNAEHLANAFGAWRVSVTQPKPRRLDVRAFRADPLTEAFPVTDLPRFDGRHLHLGRDELGDMRRFSIANHSSIAFQGNPGRGKTECALSLVWQLAPSPLVELYILDGGELDWQPFAAGAKAYVTDVPAAADVLTDLAAGMNERRRTMPGVLGTRNVWAAGLSAEWPLRVVLVEECPAFLDETGLKGTRQTQVRECRGLLAGLLRRGRAPGYLTVLMAQKAVSDSGLPPALRDLAGLRWSFGVATTDAAAAMLGSDIRAYESLSPVRLQGDEHVGVASCLLRTGMSPYTLVRFPAVGQQLADKTALELAQRRIVTKTISVTPPALEAVKAS
jgi:DNA segregation ATPase FtsK/SpoIIIE, S-DNA-T family